MARVDYDEMSSAYDAGRSLSEESVAAWTAAFAPYLPDSGPILDAGSGTGRFTTVIAEGFDVRVIGVEPSAGMRRRACANARHPRVSYVGGDAQRLPLAANSCAAAVLSMVIHHVPEPERCAAELRRVLRPDAPVLLRGWFPGEGDTLMLFRYFPGTIAILDTFPTVDQVESWFATAGFAKVAFERVTQLSAPSLRVFAERVRTRADTTLTLLPDDEFERGLAELERDAATETEPTPIREDIHLLVLS